MKELCDNCGKNDATGDNILMQEFQVKTRIIVKTETGTEIRRKGKGEWTETVQAFVLAIPRKKEKCGVWIDSVKVLDKFVPFKYSWKKVQK